MKRFAHSYDEGCQWFRERDMGLGYEDGCHRAIGKAVGVLSARLVWRSRESRRRERASQPGRAIQERA
jgi:hypothetical protein